jgi:hypothetical protein
VIPWGASWLGYDPSRVAELSPRLQRALFLVALASVPSVVLLTASAGYGAFLASDSAVLGGAVGLGAGLYLLNLLRVAVAGGGVGPQQPFGVVTTWMPRTVPLVMLGLLGVFFAQPLILAVLKGEQDASVEELRRSLTALHASAVLKAVAEEQGRAEAAQHEATQRLERGKKALEASEQDLASLPKGAQAGRRTAERAVAEHASALEALRTEVERTTAALARAREHQARVQAQDLEPYQRSLAHSHFLLRRVQLTWDRPLRPLLLSVMMVLLMVLPWLASATVGRTVSRAYEAGRWKATRAVIEAAYAEARRLEAQALSRWPSFTGLRLELHEDAPYNTKVRSGAGAFEATHG